MGNFKIEKPELFKPRADYILNSRSYDKAVNNIKSKTDYYPRLTLYSRPSQTGRKIELRIEFSAPKMIFKNNLDEVIEEDFSRVLELLHVKLDSMGISIDYSMLANASVSSFHPSKNVSLSGYWTATGAIRELNKIILPKTFDLDNKRYSNSGHSLQYYTNSHSLVFYDKINDMGKPAKRAIDKDKTTIQTELFRKVEEIRRERSGNPIEILRMEVRLSKRRKMNEILQKLGYPINPTFKGIFKKEICQRVLKLYWEEMILKRNLFLLNKNDNPQDILGNILRNNRTKRLKQAIYETGIIILAKDEEGMRGLRQVAESNFSIRTWYRAEKDIKEISKSLELSDCYGFIKNITSSIEEFKSFRSSSLLN